MKPAASKTPATSAPAGGRSLLQRLAAFNRYREQYNPLRGLTLHRVLGLLEDFQRGAMADIQWLYFFIEQTDEDLIALIELSLSRIAEMDWDVVASEEADEAVAAKQKAFIRAKLDKIDNLEEVIEHLAMARFRGFAHCEKWMQGGDIVHLEIVDQWNAVRDGLKGGWRYNPDATSITFAGLPAENDMPPENFLYREVRRHVDRVAAKKFVRSALQERDWDSFNSITGLPSGVVIGPQNVPVGKEAEYEASAKTIAEGGSGYQIPLHEAKTTRTLKPVKPTLARVAAVPAVAKPDWPESMTARVSVVLSVMRQADGALSLGEIVARISRARKAAVAEILETAVALAYIGQNPEGLFCLGGAS